MQSERRRVAGLNLGQSWSGEVAGFAGVEGNGQAALVRVVLGQLTAGRGNVSVAVARAHIGVIPDDRQREATVREDRVRQGSAGLFAESAVQWLPGLRSIAGARVEAARFDVGSSLEGAGGKVGAHIASPKLSMVLGPWARTEYFLHYGTGFHSNDARGVTQTRLPDGAAVAPATPLVATRGGEFGVRSELLPGLQSSLALWSLAVDSELLFVGDAGATAPSRASRRRGVEWSNHYRMARWLRLDLELAASRARFTGADPDGNFVPGALDRAAALGLAVSAPGRGRCWRTTACARRRPCLAPPACCARSTRRPAWRSTSPTCSTAAPATSNTTTPRGWRADRPAAPTTSTSTRWRRAASN